MRKHAHPRGSWGMSIVVLLAMAAVAVVLFLGNTGSL